MRDHYATLGVTPSSEQVVIHAAYRALMRRYHPDTNPGGETGERVRAITAAYAVLRDPERRAEYDLARAVGDPLQALQMGKGAWPLEKRPPAARGLGLAAIAIAALTVAAVWSLPRPEPRAAQPPAERAQSRQPGESTPPEIPPENPALHLASQPPIVPPPAPVASPPEPVEPVAHPALEPAPALPDRQPPASQRRAMAAASPIVPAPIAIPAARRPAATEPRANPAAPRIVPAPKTAAAPAACVGMQCTSERVAALEQHSVLLFDQSMRRADPARRQQLESARGGLIARRSACRSEACLAGTYLAHLREVSAIVESGAAP